MTKILLIVSVLTLSIFSGCIKNDDVIFRGSVAEIDQTTWNANAAGLSYPILTRIPAAGRALTATCPDSTLRRYSGTIRVRINLVGAQSDNDQTVGYEIFNSPVDSTAFPATLGFTCNPPATLPACYQTPTMNAAPSVTITAVSQTPPTGICTPNFSRLPVQNAVAGTHYTALTGKVTIPAKSSFGFIDIQILNSGSLGRQARFLGIQLNNSGTIQSSANYSQLGLMIDQR